jgi:hypothetical protein
MAPEIFFCPSNHSLPLEEKYKKDGASVLKK